VNYFSFLAEICPFSVHSSWTFCSSVDLICDVLTYQLSVYGSLATWHRCSTRWVIDIKSTRPTVEGIIHRQTIFVSTFVQTSPCLFLIFVDHTFGIKSAHLTH